MISAAKKEGKAGPVQTGKRTRPSQPPAPANRSRQLSTRVGALSAEQQARNAAVAVRDGGNPWSGGAPIPAALSVQLSPEDAGGEQAPFGVIIEDNLPVGPGQVSRSEFLVKLGEDLAQVVGAELAAVGRTTQDCPYLQHWLAFYRTQTAARIERAIQKYVKPEHPDLPGIRAAILDRARTAARLWIASGMPGAAGATAAAILPAGIQPFGSTDNAGGAPDLSAIKAKPAAGASQPGPGSAAAVRGQLGAGRPLDTGVRARMESGFGTSFTDVRLHTDANAARVSSAYSARAFAVGRDVGFASGAYRPGTLAGDALIAHELAHVVQQRGATRDGGMAQSRESERDADRAAIDLLTERDARPATGAGRMQFSACGDNASVDWRGLGEASYNTAASHIQDLQKERQILLQQAGMDAGRADRLAAIDKEMREWAAAIQQLGVQRDIGDILARVVKGENLRTVTITSLTGDDPVEILWGERREFKATVSYVPLNTEVKVLWGFWFGGSEFAFGHGSGGAPPASGTAVSEPRVLEGDFWGEFEKYAPKENQEIGRDPGFQIMATLFVGGKVLPDTDTRTKWLKVKRKLPTKVEIKSPQLDRPTAPSGAATAVTPPATATGGAGAAPGGGGGSGKPPGPAAPTAPATAAPNSGSDIVLEGAQIRYELSWIPPMEPGETPRYGIWWYYEKTEAGKTTHTDLGPLVWAPIVGNFWAVKGPFSSPGDYKIVAAVLSAKDRDAAYPGYDPAPVLPPAVRELKVLSAVDAGAQALESYAKAGGPVAYNDFTRDLDQQIDTLEQTLAAGSMTPGVLKSQLSDLKKQRDKLIDKMGGKNVQPFPANDADFNQDQSYASPIVAVIAHPQYGGAVPLAIYVRVWYEDGQWQARVVDTTTQDVVRFNGSGASASAAVADAAATWKDKNDYPRGGMVHYRLARSSWNVAGSFSTNSASKTFWEWFDKITFIPFAVIGIVLLLVPEPTMVTKAVGLTLLGISILRSSYAIYRNLSLGRPVLDQRNILEALSILSSALGLRGGALLGKGAQLAKTAATEAAVARAITTVRVGRGLLMTSYAIDAGTFIWVSEEAMRQLESASSSGASDEEKEQMAMQMALQLSLQAVMLVGAGHQLFSAHGGGKGLLQALAERGGPTKLDPSTRARLETELRQHGVEQEVTGLSDADLLHRYAQVKQAAFEGVEKASAQGAVLGEGVYKLEPTAQITAGDALNWMSSGFRKRLGGQVKIDVTRTGGKPTGAVMHLEIPGTGGGAARTIDVQLSIATVGDITALPSVHGKEAGPGRVSVSKDPSGNWVANITLDDRLGGAQDVRQVLGHECDEAARIIQKKELDPKVDIEAEHQANVFGGLGTGPPTGHDQAAAWELKDLYGQLEDKLKGYAGLNQEQRRAGNIPPDMQRAVERINAALDNMGFRDPTTRDSKMQALATELGKALPDELKGYITDQYGRAVAGETRLAAYKASSAFPGGTESVFSPEVVAHLEKPEAQGGGAGVYGGHEQNGLYAFVDGGPTVPTKGGRTVQRYQVSFVREKTAAGSKFRLHVQWERTMVEVRDPAHPNDPSKTVRVAENISTGVPARDMSKYGAGAATFEDAAKATPYEPGWDRLTIPKTTVENLDVLMGHAEAAFRTWESAPPPITGNTYTFGEVGGNPPLVSPAGVELGGKAIKVGSKWKLVGVWVEAGYFFK